jgi:glycosyltransferase involved in cell wall biosynthesis
MKKDGITVIIPCYNVENYIDKCLNSILNQTFKNLEIIVVDDCSTDNTVKIIKKYIKQYQNIKLIQNKINSGAGYSRNMALKESTNEIISFIDGDDYIEENYYEELLKSMFDNNSDIAICDIFVRYQTKNGQSDVRSVACEGDLKPWNVINNGLAASPCNKLIKKQLLLKFPFAEGIMNEDIPSILAVLINDDKISYAKNTYYNYVQRDTSVQNQSISLKRFDIFKALDILRDRIKNSKKFKSFWEAIIYQQVIMFFIYVIPKEPSFIKRYKILKKFNKMSHKYNIRKNSLLWNFLAGQGRYHKLYYKTILKFNCIGFYFLTNILISLYNFYRKELVKTVIKKDITLDDVVKMAKRQSKMKPNNFNISVVIPNYNYERFILQRIYSILYQKVKINELIILDDCSRDNSRELIDKVYNELSSIINIKKVYNETNSGSAFKQWQKGFKLAEGKYVWIAEADDYCDKQFLRKITKPLKNNQDIVLSYADTAFIDVNGKIIMRTIKPEIDIRKTGHWDKSYINDGIDEIKNYSYLNCTIANVSSTLMKNDNYDDFFKMSGKYKQAGDWLFYVNIMTRGKISYYNKPLNYYRVHGNNVTSTTKKQAHFDEIKKIHSYFIKKFNLKDKHKKNINKRYSFLKKVWNIE